MVIVIIFVGARDILWRRLCQRMLSLRPSVRPSVRCNVDIL